LFRSRPVGLTHVLQALARNPTLSKLRLRGCNLDRDNAKKIGMVLCNSRTLHTLCLKGNRLGSAGLAELAPALYHNTSIKVLDMPYNDLNDTASAALLLDILRINRTMTALDLSGNTFGDTTLAVQRIADGLGSNSTLLKVDLSSCALKDVGFSILAQTLGSQSTTLQKLTLNHTQIKSTGVGVLLEAMEQGNHITDLDLQYNPIRNEGASLLAMALENNLLPNLKHLSLSECGISDDGFIALILALKQNTSLLHLDLLHDYGVSERTFLVLAENLPEIQVLQRVDLRWCTDLGSNMPLLLAGLRKNTSLFRFHVATRSSFSVPPVTIEGKSRYAGGWMQEMERLGYRNRFLPLLRAPKERLPPRAVWPRALARVATLPDVIFEVLRSKPNLVPSEDKKSAKDTGVSKKRNRGDE
jgi:hypothetical protein